MICFSSSIRLWEADEWMRNTEQQSMILNRQYYKQKQLLLRPPVSHFYTVIHPNDLHHTKKPKRNTKPQNARHLNACRRSIPTSYEESRVILRSDAGTRVRSRVSEMNIGDPE